MTRCGMTRTGMTRTGITRAAAALVLLAVCAPGAGARPADIRGVPPPGIVKSAATSCAGGAVIGALVVYVGGLGAVMPIAGMFCGLSVALTAAGAVTDGLTRIVDQYLGKPATEVPR